MFLGVLLIEFKTLSVICTYVLCIFFFLTNHQNIAVMKVNNLPALSSVTKEFCFICIQINQRLLKTPNCMLDNCFGRKEGERERKREVLLLEKI